MYQSVDELHWLSGEWHGNLGHRMVDENWSQPRAGTITARVRVIEDGVANRLEFIHIHETAAGLVLSLQQFDGNLTPELRQDMYQVAADSHSIRFALPGNGPITSLHYTRTEPERLQVQVTLSDGSVLVANLQRQSR